MKGLSVYKIVFKMELSDNIPNPSTEKDYNELTEKELTKVIIREMRIEKKITEALNRNIVIEEDYMDCVETEVSDTLTWYLFIPNTQRQNLENFCEEVNETDEISVEPIEDITEQVLFENKYIEHDDEYKTFESFLENNLSKDNILDKITSLGFTNLSKTDKKILNK
jgi:hypothetical protein